MMNLQGREKAALVLSGLVALVAMWQADETISALKYWWNVKHASATDFVVPHWATSYSWVSALFAPLWLALIIATVFFLRRWPTALFVVLGAYLLIAPVSCAYAPALDAQAGGFLGLEELPFADAERAPDAEQLERLDQLISRRGERVGEFPTSFEALKSAVGDTAFERSPYEQAGKQLSFDLRFVLNQGRPYSTNPERPGVVYYAVNPSGSQFVLTISGLNAPISNRASMMRAGSFVGGKQPWSGLLATEGTLHQR